MGRGSLAGPLLVAAVVLDSDIPGLKDSKKLSKNKRSILYFEIIHNAQAIGIGIVSSKYIDKYGLTLATKKAMKDALKQIKVPYDKIIIDGNYNYLSENPKSSTLIKADNLIDSVSAASIVAKVTRDLIMTKLDVKHSQYGFKSNVGYGTKKHLAAIREYGPLSIHRLSYSIFN